MALLFCGGAGFGDHCNRVGVMGEESAMGLGTHSISGMAQLGGDMVRPLWAVLPLSQGANGRRSI